MYGCSCEGGGLGNLGVSNCAPKFSVTNKLAFMPIYDSTGVKNKIDLTATLNEAFFVNLLNETDPSKRLYVSPVFENVDKPRADSTFEEFPSGRKIKIKNGKKSFTGVHAEASEQLEDHYKNFACGQFGVFEIDINGQLKGKKLSVTGTDLYPIPVDNNSFDTKFVDAKDGETSKLMISFDFDRLMKDYENWMITADEVGFDFNDLNPLFDASLIFNAKTSTTVVVDLQLQYGTALERIAIEGAVAADFSLYDNTDSASVTLSSVVESSTVAGRYTCTFTAITGSTHNLTLTFLKDGYEKATLDFVDA